MSFSLYLYIPLSIYLPLLFLVLVARRIITSADEKQDYALRLGIINIFLSKVSRCSPAMSQCIQVRSVMPQKLVSIRISLSI